MDRRSRFVYGSGPTDLTLSVSSRVWTPMDRAEGVARTTAAGVPATALFRRDVLLSLSLRVRETEWGAVRDFLRFGMTSQPFDYYPDADEATVAQVYLHEPEVGTDFTPSRDGDYPRVLDVPIVLRASGIASPWLPYF